MTLVCQINVTNFYRKRLKEREPISQRTFLKNECCQAKKKESSSFVSSDNFNTTTRNSYRHKKISQKYI